MGGEAIGAQSMASWGKRAALSLAAVILTLGILEMFVRASGIGFVWGVCSGGLVPHPNSRLRYVLRANYSGYENGAWVTTDSLGLRDGRQGRKSGRPRILVLGDSMVFGFGVKDDQTMPHYLSELLGHELGADVEVLNAGVVGYDTEQEFERGNELVQAIAPDAIVVIFVANDIEDVKFSVDSGGNLHGVHYRETGQECRPTSFTSAVELPLLRYSELYNVARFAWKSWTVRRVVAVSDRDALGREYRYAESQWNEWTAQLDRARSIATPWRIPVAFLVLSSGLPNRATHDRVMREIAARGFRVWTTLPEMGIYREGTTPPEVAKLHLWWDIHPSPEGHRLVAGILRDRMKTDGWGPFAAERIPLM